MTRIGLLTDFDVDSDWARSTNLSHMARSLRGMCEELVNYGPLEARGDRLRGALEGATRRLAPATRYSAHFSLRRSRALGRAFRRRFERQPSDLVFAPKGSVNSAYLELPVPLVYESDATFALLDGYYPSVTGLSARSREAAHEVERRSMARAAALVFHTRWAAESAVRDYGADPAKVFAIPIGPNIDPALLPAADALPERGVEGRCRLLLVGVSWERKGGDVALQTLEALTRRGVDAELTVVGCTPPAGIRHPRLRVVGYLSKARPAERARLWRLYREATFLLVPTRAECFGCVYAEASAWGLPSLATRTGGVPEVVLDGVNGRTLPLEAEGKAYADLVVELLADPARYAALVRGSRERFETVLNWDVWARRVEDEVLAPLLA